MTPKNDCKRMTQMILPTQASSDPISVSNIMYLGSIAILRIPIYFREYFVELCVKFRVWINRPIY